MYKLVSAALPAPTPNPEDSSTFGKYVGDFHIGSDGAVHATVSLEGQSLHIAVNGGPYLNAECALAQGGLPHTFRCENGIGLKTDFMFLSGANNEFDYLQFSFFTLMRQAASAADAGDGG